MRFRPPLDEQIKKLRAEIDEFIDSRAEEIKRQNPGIPVAVLRNLVIARNPDCQCAQYLEIKKQDDR
jgi:hypothetical protein